MLRLDRNEIADIPRPVYELFVDWDGPDAVVGVMVGMGASLPCCVELFRTTDSVEFRDEVTRWLIQLPYFESGDRMWASVAGHCAYRFADHIFFPQQGGYA